MLSILTSGLIYSGVSVIILIFLFLTSTGLEDLIGEIEDLFLILSVLRGDIVDYLIIYWTFYLILDL